MQTQMDLSKQILKLGNPFYLDLQYLLKLSLVHSHPEQKNLRWYLTNDRLQIEE